MKVARLLCDRTFIPTRAPLEDHATVLMRYDNGARGRLWVSSVDAGNMGSQRYRFVGSNASLAWSDSHPDELVFYVQGEPERILPHGTPYLEEESLAVDRMGALHTRGARRAAATPRSSRPTRYPSNEAGTQGVRWGENCDRSADAGAARVDVH